MFFDVCLLEIKQKPSKDGMKTVRTLRVEKIKFIFIEEITDVTSVRQAVGKQTFN